MASLGLLIVQKLEIDKTAYGILGSANSVKTV